MDTIFIAKETLESLHHFIPDSVLMTSGKGLHVILPDSIKTFQAKEQVFALGLSKKDFISLSGVIISTCAMIIALISFFATGRREREKEKIRIDKLQNHIIYYLELIKIKLINKGTYYNVTGATFSLHYKKKAEIPEQVQIPFNAIFSLPLIDLSEILVMRSRNPENGIYKMDLLQRSSNYYNQDMVDFNTILDKFNDDVAKFQNESQIILTRIKETNFSAHLFTDSKYVNVSKRFFNYSSDDKIYDIEFWYNTKNGINELKLNTNSLDVHNFKSNVDLFIERLEQFNITLQWFKVRCNDYRVKTFELAINIELLENYYKNKITEEEFKKGASSYLRVDYEEMDRLIKIVMDFSIP